MWIADLCFIYLFNVQLSVFSFWVLSCCNAVLFYRFDKLIAIIYLSLAIRWIVICENFILAEVQVEFWLLFDRRTGSFWFANLSCMEESKYYDQAVDVRKCMWHMGMLSKLSTPKYRKATQEVYRKYHYNLLNFTAKI